MLLLSSECWALLEAEALHQEALWQEFMKQGKQRREQRRFAEAEKDFLAAVTAAQ